MTEFEALSNKAWLEHNKKEAEFEYFCKMHDLEQNHPVSLLMFKNKEIKSAKIEKMRTSFFDLDGFFIAWDDKHGQTSYLFNQSEALAREFFDKSKDEQSVELYQKQNGEVFQVA